MPSLSNARALLYLTGDELSLLTEEWPSSAAARTSLGGATAAASRTSLGGATAAASRRGAPLPDFLRPTAVEANLEFCGIAFEHRRAVHDALSRLVVEPEAVSLAVHLRHRLFETDCRTTDWPDVADRSPLLSCLYLVVGSSMVPAVRELHEARGIDEEVTRATCNEVAGFCTNHLVAHPGAPGLLPPQLYWLRHYPAGRLFRVGRFEYMVGEHRHAGPVYRHRAHGWTLALADPDRSYTADGLEQCDPDVSGAWTPVLEEADGSVRGNPIDPRGVALRTTVALGAAEWERVLAPGDPVLELHIPAGGGMTPDAAKDSFARSFDFFERYVTTTRLKGIVCRSWIFNTQLEQRMPDSNLADLMRQVYLVPARGSGRDGLFFIFCRDYDRLEDYPRQTRMQRALLDVLEGGGRLRATGMVMLRDDVERMGSQPYRGGWESMAASGVVPGGHGDSVPQPGFGPSIGRSSRFPRSVHDPS
ncbi:MAG: acyltransferase domain-containing protein [Spirochaetota bacterium]